MMRATGWRPQPPDHRDLIFDSADHPLASGLPSQVDLSPGMPAIYDQGQLGSCTGNGIARAVEFDAMKQGQLWGTPSRLFIYYGERAIEGTINDDAGANIRDGIKVIASQGVPPETDWPYSDANPGPFTAKPSPAAYAAALPHAAVRYRAVKIGPGAPFRTALAAGFPIVFGFSVPASFEDGSWDPTSQALPLPQPSERIIGGHCVVASGYDWTCSRFPFPAWQCENSWGAGWGMGGRFWMNAGYFNQLASDFWVIDQIK